MTSSTSLRSIPAFTPTMLTTYHLCPAKYRARYVDRELGSVPASPTIARGQAAHAALRHAFEVFQRSHSFPLDLAHFVDSALSHDGYTSEAERQADVGLILDWVRPSLAEFDGSAEVLAVERTFQYAFPGNTVCPQFRLRATVDLVLRHPDGVIEHIDWKSGKTPKPDPIQMVASRIVVGQEYRKRSEVRSTTSFISIAGKRSDILTREQVSAVWTDIKSLVVAIASEQEWPTVSNTLCPWCPLYGNSCALYPTRDEDDSMTGWLEGVA